VQISELIGVQNGRPKTGHLPSSATLKLAGALLYDGHFFKKNKIKAGALLCHLRRRRSSSLTKS